MGIKGLSSVMASQLKFLTNQKSETSKALHIRIQTLKVNK